MSYLDELLGGRSLAPVTLPAGIGAVLKDAASNLSGIVRRAFMANTARALGKGGQRQLEETLDWNRGTIRKGERELDQFPEPTDNLSKRGRKPVENDLPALLRDIGDIVKPRSQTDPTFRTATRYTPLSAKAVRGILIETKGYRDAALPCERTISNKLGQLGFRPRRVAKSKPLKKIKQTNAIFEQVHKINKNADETNGVLRLSMDAKATIKVGPFSRGGKNRHGQNASDHDFAPKERLTPWGIFLPAYDESFLYFTKSAVTPDFMIDSLEDLWPNLDHRFHPNMLVFNLDNGPENNSHRTQFIKRVVTFAYTCKVKVRLAYYPPYHSKYNPVERLWGILENHWRGEILDSTEKVLGMANSMSYNGMNPIVKLVEGEYQKGKKLSKRQMKIYEAKIKRHPELGRWFVDIDPCSTPVLG